MKTEPRIAMFLCAQNEERFLEAHLRYHYDAGIRRVFLFLDGSEDRSREISERFEWIDIIEIPAEEKSRHPYICDLHRACMEIAKDWAHEEGWDWLLCIDPDEFVIARPELLDGGDRAGAMDLRGLLGRVDTGIHQVRIPTWEAVPEEGRKWWELTGFQTDDQVSYRLPGEGERSRGFLGHRQGKSIIRTGVRVQAYDSHRWVIDQRHWGAERPEFADIPTVWLGGHLHYYLTDAGHLLSKFQKATFEPDHWFCGKPVERSKQLFKDVSGEWSLERAERYMAKELSPRIETGALARVSLIRDSVCSSGVIPGESRGDPVAGERVFPDGYDRRALSGRARSCWSRPRLPATAGIQEIIPEDIRGMHGLESCGDRVFRWTELEFAVRLPPEFEPDARVVRLDMGQLGRVFRRLLPGRGPFLMAKVGSEWIRLRRRGASWIFSRAPDGNCWLEFRVGKSIRFREDSRVLGIPLFTIHLES